MPSFGEIDATGYYISEPTIIADGTETTCYTVPTGKWAYITQIWAADDGGAARTITIIARKGGTDYTLGFQVAIAANTALIHAPDPLVLAAADSIKCTVSAGGVHVMISGIEESAPGT